MFESIREYYYRKIAEMDLKQKWKGLLNQLSRHLLEFASEGRDWIRRRLLEDSEEYLHQVNVKCSWANHLNEEVLKIRSRIISDISYKDKYKSDIYDLKKLLESIRLFIITSVNLVPYSGIDELNLLVHKIDTYISTGCYE